MVLYNCKADRGAAQFVITKFDDSLNVEASYLLTPTKCSCPSWPRKSHCKHIDMLEKFRRRGYVDTEWFLDKNGGWHQPLGPWADSEPIEVGSTPFPSEAEAWSTILGEKIDAVHDGVLIKNSPSGPDSVPCSGPEAAEVPTPRASAVSLRRQIR